ncbi:MAG: hypothetical protein HC803_09900 [Saprospiraceae bacterium]|nr:hypothetical protein [Saprospiraceae bacterium]
MQCSIYIPSTLSINAFVFQHHPDNIGEERQMLEFVVNILQDNATDTCTSNLAQTLSVYVIGE